MRVVVIALLAAVTLASQASAAATDAKQDLRVYLAAMAPLNARMVKAENNLTRGQLGFIEGSLTERESHTLTDPFPKELAAVYKTMQTVKAPSALRGPHAGFLQTVKVEASRNPGSRPATMRVLRAQWVEEVTAQLRFLGLVVPLWVKNIEWAF
jgi:hypothetical protein